jgi:hypothetical protein
LCYLQLLLLLLLLLPLQPYQLLTAASWEF